MSAPRRRRNLWELRTAINALTAAQKAAIWTDLTSGTPPKIATDRGPNAGALLVLHFIATMGTTLLPADVTEAKLRAATLYVADNASYLEKPEWAPTIDVSLMVPI